MKELIDLGHKVAIHFDPILYTPKFKDEYRQLILDLKEAQVLSRLEYISIGVVRFTPSVFKEVERNYPESPLLAQELNTDQGLVRYSKKMRDGILSCIFELLVQAGVSEDRIYRCMEE